MKPCSGLVAFAILAFFVLCTQATGFSQIANTTHPANSPYASVQAAINDPITLAGDTITLGPGTHSSGGTTITVNKSITIIGASEATVFVDVSSNGAAWGINVAASNVTMKNFTVIPVAAVGGGYPVHVSNVPSVISNITLEHITVSGGRRTGFDLHGVDNSTLSHRRHRRKWNPDVGLQQYLLG